MILGMDGLESQNNGNMWVNWQKKTIRFKHEGARITLIGVQASLDNCTAISAKTLQGMAQSGEINNLLEVWPIY
jgi:hypothetical protein